MGELPEQAEDTFTHEYVVDFIHDPSSLTYAAGSTESTESFNNFFK